MKLTAENYFSTEAERLYMGSTQFKRFMQCEACAMARIRGEWIQPKTTAMLVGSYVDAHFGGELEKFCAENESEIFSIKYEENENTVFILGGIDCYYITKNNTINSKKISEAKKLYPQAFTKIRELKSEFKQAEKIIERIERDAVFKADLSGQQQVIMTGVINGVPFKIKVDSLLPNMTVDLKIMKDCSDSWQDGELLPFWKAWGYDIQAAIYREIRAQNDGEIKPFRLAVATKETEPDLQIYEFSDETLDEAYQTVYNLAPRFEAIKRGEIEAQRCGCCDYCKATKKLTNNDIRRI